MLGVTLTCGFALAATVAPEGNARSAALAKSSRPMYLSLSDSVMRASHEPFSRYQSENSFAFLSHKEAENSASPLTLALFPDQETRPITSLMIGWLPAKNSANTAGPYQPRSYQYATTKADANCISMDRAAGSALETSDDNGNGLRLPAGWMLGMCLHY